MPREVVSANLRARQLQRHYHAIPEQPFRKLVTADDLRRAKTLAPSYELEPGSAEDEWPPNWSKTERSLRAFLSSPAWNSFPLERPSIPSEDEVVKKAVVAVKEHAPVTLAKPSLPSAKEHAPSTLEQYPILPNSEIPSSKVSFPLLHVRS